MDGIGKVLKIKTKKEELILLSDEAKVYSICFQTQMQGDLHLPKLINFPNKLKIKSNKKIKIILKIFLVDGIIQ